MPIDLFSRRKREKRGDVDPLRYDEVEQATRIRLLHVLDEFLDDVGRQYVGYDDTWIWETVCKILRKDLGVFELTHYSRSRSEEFRGFFLECADTDRVVDCIELIGKMIMIVADERSSMEDSARGAIKEINAWLADASIGYEFLINETARESQVIEVSDRLTHAEVIIPALHILTNKRFAPANSELLQAFDHLRKKEFGDAISEAAKALETTLKIIAADKKWPHDPNKDTMKRLLDTAIKHGGTDPMWQSHFDAVRTLLESGVATARNKFDGHGQGATERKVPAHLARFALHQSASAILFFTAANGYE